MREVDVGVSKMEQAKNTYRIYFQLIIVISFV